MFHRGSRRKEDPLTMPVKGVDQNLRLAEINSLNSPEGTARFIKPVELPKTRVLFSIKIR